MTSDVPAYQHANAHSRILGICWIIYGAIRLGMVLWLMAFSTTATVMFGALLTRVPNPFTLMADFHLIYLAITMLSAVVGVLGILAGLALLASQGFARPLALIAAFLSLSEIPLGLTLGTYTLVVLLPANPTRREVTS
jgi:hypothetical protein